MGPVLATSIIRLVIESMQSLGLLDEPSDIVDPRWRRANPCPAAVYHEALARTIPWWRWLWRRRERARALQWRALCSATERCDELADTVVRLVQLGGPAADRATRRALLVQAQSESGLLTIRNGDDTPREG